MFSKNIKKIVKVEGMSCKHCVLKVEKSFLEVDNVLKVKVNLKMNEVLVTFKKDANDNIIKSVIENLDYKVVSIIDV